MNYLQVLESSRDVNNSVDQTLACDVIAYGICGPTSELNLEKAGLREASDRLLLWHTVLRYIEN